MMTIQIAGGGGDEGGEDEDDHQQVLELLGKDLEHTLFLALSQLVWAKLLGPGLGFLARQSVGTGFLSLQGLLRGLFVVGVCHWYSFLPCVELGAERQNKKTLRQLPAKRQLSKSLVTTQGAYRQASTLTEVLTA